MAEDISVDTRTDEELDSLADSAGEARNSDRPMVEEPAAKAAGGKAGPAWTEDEIDYKGKKIKGTRDEIINWAQMGYDRPQFMQKFNQDKTAWEKSVEERESQYKQWEQKFSPYQQIDEYAAKNPDWWNHVLQAWQTRGNPQAAPGTQPTGSDPRYDTVLQRLQNFEQVIPKFEKLATEIEERRVLEQHQKEDSALDEEVQTIRKQYSDLDWNTLDEDGKTLEIRVMEHAGKIGTQSFRAAMRDLLHDELLTRAEGLGKIAVAKGIQAKTKAGVLGQSPTPRSRMPESQKNIKERSYEELAREAIEEVRQGRLG